MLKIFVTGDNHFGKKFDRYQEVKDALIESRFDSLEKMVRKASDEGCELFAITGDLFDNINTIKLSDVKRVVSILASFSGTIVVIPGNHDYYTGEEKVWKDFEACVAACDNNIILMKEYSTYTIKTSEDEVVIYPAFCQSKHSKDNNLGWIKQSNICRKDIINIGIAHGAIKGITPDMKEEYFLMSEAELSTIKMDVWLIGHTHVPYPSDLTDEDTYGYTIFNPGTHAQTDLSNNTEGLGFIITINKNGDIAKVAARKYVSGTIRFYDIDLCIASDDDRELKDIIHSSLMGLNSKSIVRIKLTGTVTKEDYSLRKQVYKDELSDFMTYEVDDSELSEKITIDKIRQEYAQTSFAAKFMEKFIDNPQQLQMVYELMSGLKK